uniref:Cilia- and flagella-associated protein 91 n=1 Tax=Mesocestoides corti TaxID=53468 RepID=A0A5K3EHA8_MESCO
MKDDQLKWANEGMSQLNSTKITTSRFLNRSVQTKFRDSEAQTDPYSPEYTIPAGEIPQLLLLINLSYGRGLPAGQKEVELIERAHKRIIEEEKMTKMTHKQRIRYRNKLEQEEWDYRTKEIEALQELRLQALAQLLRIREEKRQELVSQWIDRRWKRRQKQKEEAIKKIRAEYAAAIRQMLRSMDRQRKLSKPDKITIYSQPGSQAYAPLTRIGVFPDRGSERYKVKSHFLESYSGLLELEKFIPERMIDHPIAIKKPSKFTKDGFLKRSYRWQTELESLHEFMASLGRSEVNAAKPMRFLHKIEKPAPRPSTPSVPRVDKVQMAGELAIIELQRMLRGRAMQTMMHEARGKRQLLIDELRSTHAVTRDDRAEKRRQMLTVRTDQTRYQNLRHEDSLSHEILERLDSTILGDMLDFLSKELDRLIVDQRIRDYMREAQRERRVREAEESGKRQFEERRRRETDEYFRQVIKVHQVSVDGFFDSFMSTTIESSAEVQAVEEFEKLAKRWPVEVRKKEQQLSHEEEAADLVYNFLIPEVNRRAYKALLDQRERKYLHAAHSEIFQEVETGSLSTEIRDYEDNRTDQGTCTENPESENNRNLKENASKKP